jgi:hypothetical protein
MRKLSGVVVLSVFMLIGGAALAEGGNSPVNLALFSPIQITSETTSVDAFRFSLLYGVNQDVTGLDIGLVNVNRGNGLGVQWVAVGLVEGDFSGWQSGIVSSTKGHMYGLQSGAINITGTGEGVQWGLINKAESFKGLMLGFVNVTQNMDGLQIGLVNVIQNKDKFPVLPFINWVF